MMYDIIIVGAGVAGLTAALYAKRSGKSVLVLEEETVGGQAALSPRVENIPSIESIKGSDFTDKLFEQVLNLGAEIELEKVESITKEGGQFFVKGNYHTFVSRSVILANGVKHKHLNLENEEEMIGKGISYCAVCDGAFYKGEEVALVGDANTALQYALLLSNICPKVYMYTLFDKFFGDDALIQAVKKKENIVIVPNVSIVGYEKDEQLTAVKYKGADGNVLTQKVSALFIAIGQVADNNRFENIVSLSKDGFIITDEAMETKTAGVFAAGDCRNKKIRQITTACADGAIAALSVNSYIEKC